jgi:tetratricopeptide (TPR) repeat protein
MATLGRFEILEEAGRGGFAVVYQARDPDLDRVVALKVLAPHLTWDPSFADRFRREAQATANLNHPNIVVIHEVSQKDQESLYIAMEYLPGQTLTQLLEDGGAMPLERAVPILEQVASALDYAHGEGMLHRDVKPSNVMVQEGKGGDVRATLTDFGLVKAMESSESLTSSGTILGSPEYMAPEQADLERVHEIGPATDLYALGVVAYEMLVGRVPFQGSPTATLVAHIQKTPPDPQSIREDLPADVARVLLKALAKRGEDRYPSAGALVQALRESAKAGQEAGQTEENLARLHQQIEDAVEAEDWVTAEARCREILALDADYRNVPELWIVVRKARARQQELEERYEMVQAAMERGAWAEAAELCQQIEALQPGYRDVGTLLARAAEELRRAQAEEERQARLASLYDDAQTALEDERWAEAERLCNEIQELEPGYRDVADLQSIAREGLLAEQDAKEPERPVPPPPEVEPVSEEGEPTVAKERKKIPGRVWVVVGVVAVVLVIVGLVAVQLNEMAQDRARATMRARWTSDARARATKTAQAAVAEEAQPAGGEAEQEVEVVEGTPYVVVQETSVWGDGTVVVEEILVTLTPDAGAIGASAGATAAARAVIEAKSIPVPEGWSAQIQETFDSNTRGWTVGVYSDEWATGTAVILTGIYHLEFSSDSGVNWKGSPRVQNPASDLLLSVEARRTGGPADSLSYGLVFRKQDDTNFYYFGISDGGRLAVYALVDGAWVKLIEESGLSAVRPGETNHLTVHGKGSQFAFLVNGEYVGSVEDSSHAEGTVGVAIEIPKGMEGSFEFDNFELYTP